MRADGKRIKNIDPMEAVGAYIMNKRTDALNMTTIDIPYEPIHEYLNKKRGEGIHLSHMSVLITAYLRTVAEHPELNRFVVNKRYYARNELSVAMVVLKAGSKHNGTMSKMYFEHTDTIFEVNKKIVDYVEENRNSPENNGTEKMIKFLLSLPGILNIGVPIFKFMDRYGLLPKSIIDVSPFHNSLAISNLISIKTNHVLHHCYNFGTTSVFMTMGNLREVPRRKDNEIYFEKCMPIGVVMDERICTGAYFSYAFRTLKKYLANPSLLELPPQKIEKDSGV